MRIATLVVLALGLIACGSDGGAGEGTAEGRSCKPSDTLQGDCPADFVCESLSGTVGVCSTAGEVDVPCESTADCGSGLTCREPWSSADFKVCLDPTPPADGSCDYDLHCGDSAYCDWETDRCIEGTGSYCDYDPEVCFGGERCHETRGRCYVP